jgi:prophage regulatory protein
MNIIRLKKTLEKTGLGRSTLYKKIAEGTFPQPVPLSDRAVGWVAEEVENWLRARLEERDRLALVRPVLQSSVPQVSH